MLPAMPVTGFAVPSVTSLLEFEGFIFVNKYVCNKKKRRGL